MRERAYQLTHGQHCCAFYDSAAQRREMVVEFVRDGLDAGDRVAYFTDTRSPADVLDDLHAAGLHPDAALASGQLAVRSADDSYLAELPFDPERMVATLHAAVDAALSDGFTGFRVSGDMSWATRGVPGGERLLEYESRVGEVFATRPAAAICQYDRRLFDAGTLAATLGLHTRESEPRPALEVEPLSGGRGLRLCGEADLAARGRLQEALSELAGPVIHLWLDGLRFMDACSLGELLNLAAPPRRVVLHDPPNVVRRMLDLLPPNDGLEVRCS